MRQQAQQEDMARRKAEKQGNTLSPPTSPTRGTTGGQPQNVVGAEERNWFQKQKDKLVGTKEERRKAKEERERHKAEVRKKARVGDCDLVIRC